MRFENRKEAANAMAQFLGVTAEYQFMPTCAYKIGEYTINQAGELEGELTPELDAYLRDKGFIAEMDLVIEVPKENLNIENLKNVLEAKGELIKKALAVENLNIEEGDRTYRFPWFKGQPEEALSYAKFIEALSKMSKEQKRINKHRAEPRNEKYAFRCFLLRLGFIGCEFKEDRKILLKNFKGNAAFKDGVSRVIVAGSRGFDDKDLLTQKLDEILEGLKQITIVSGTARGADKLGEDYAKERGLKVKRVPADWETHHRAAGHIRNKQMAEYAAKEKGILVAFWDGESKGTASMIEYAKEKGLEVHVINFRENAE